MLLSEPAEIKCYLEEYDNHTKCRLRDKKSNKIVVIPITVDAERLALLSLFSYCKHINSLYHRNNELNYISVFYYNKTETETEIITKHGSAFPKNGILPVRYELTLDKNTFSLNNVDLMANINNAAPLEYILHEIYEILDVIQQIEKSTNIILVGDRISLYSPVIEYKNQKHKETYGQIQYKFSIWRNGILHRYIDKL